MESETLKPSEKTLRILIVVSQPKDQNTVKADEVIQAIEKLKERLPDAIEIHRLDQPDEQTFSEKIEDKPHVLHFIGHGKWDKNSKTGKLAFVDGVDGSALWIDDKDFSDYFQDFQPRLIFLHACDGASSETYEEFRGVALQLVYSRVPAVVAMQYPITNKAAIKFAQKFYECLGEGKPIDLAVQEGRLQLAMYLKEKHFSSRAFGSPVAFLQSADGIIIAEKKDEVVPSGIEPPLTKVPCPYPGCHGEVMPDYNICIVCRRHIMRCPRCGAWPLAEDIGGVCFKCGYQDSWVKPIQEQVEPSLKEAIDSRYTISGVKPVQEQVEPSLKEAIDSRYTVSRGKSVLQERVEPSLKEAKYKDKSRR